MATTSLKTFLASTLFTSALCAMENQNCLHPYLMGSSPVVRNVASAPHGIKEILYQMVQEIGHQGMEIVKESGKCIYYGGQLAWHGEYGFIAVELIEQSLRAANQKMFSEFFKPKRGRENEFDVDTLRPLVEKIRLNICWMIDYYYTRRTMHDYKPDTEKEILIYENKTLFHSLMDACIPDIVPGKGLFIRFADFKPIRDYLIYKFDEMVILGLLSFYQEMTGKTIKQSIAEWVNKPAYGKEKEQTKNKEKELEKPAAPFQERDELTKSILENEGAEILAHHSLMDENVEKDALLFLSQQEEENAPKKEVKEAASHVWRYLQPRLTHFLRKAIEEVITPSLKTFLLDVGDYLQKKYVSNKTHITLFGTTMLGSVGAAGLVGLPIGLVGYFTVNTMAGKVVSGVRSSLEDAVNKFIQYHLYQVLPYSKQEHYLYHLNNEPTKDERLILASDYGAQEKLRKETLIKALVADVMAYSWLSFLNLGGVDELKEESKASVGKKNGLSAMIRLGEIAVKKKRGHNLTEKEERLVANLKAFTSYDVKEQELTLLNLWGREKENIERAKQFEKEYQEAEEKLIKIYELYGCQIPGAIALAYQYLGMWGEYEGHDRLQLDYMDVHNIIKKSLRKYIGLFSPKDLNVLEEAVNDGDFLMEFMETNIVGPVICIYQSVKERCIGKIPTDIGEYEARSLLKSPEFLKNLVQEAVKRKHTEYLNKYGSDIESLQNSVLGFSLSLGDIIDLHQMMNEEDRAKYRNYKTHPYERALKEAVDSLKGEKEVEHGPAVQAIREELEFIRSKVNDLVQGDRHEIVQHYARVFIDKVSKNPDTYKLIQEKIGQYELIFKEADFQAEKHISIDSFPQLKERYKNVDSEKLQRLLQKYNFFIKYLLQGEGEWPVFNLFRKDLPNYVKTGEIRTGVYRQISNFILDYLLEKTLQPDTCVVNEMVFYVSHREDTKTVTPGEDKSKKQGNGQEEGKETNFSPSSSHEEVAYNTSDGKKGDQNNAQEEHFLEVVITPYAGLGVYDTSDVAGYALSTIANKLITLGEIKDVTALSWDNVGSIHQEIQNLKRQKANESMCLDTICFIDKGHLCDLIAFKKNLPEYKSRLFYGYTEIVAEILAHNKLLIERFERSKKNLNLNDSTSN